MLLARLLDVLLDVVDDPVHERMLEPLLDGLLAPGQIDLALRRVALHALRVLEQPLGRVGAPVEDQILDELEQLRPDVLVHGQLAGVDDAHVEPRLDGVEEERGVDRLAHVVGAAKGEGEVRDPARHPRAGTALLDQARRVDERLRELGVLLDPRADGEDVRVEDDVLRREAGALGEQPVRAPADLDLALDRLGLTLLVERHDERGRAEAPHPARLVEERLLSLLEAERVGDALALDALQAGLEDGEARAVDHDRQHGHLGLRRDEVEEARHRRLGVEEVRVHVDVEQVGAAADLVERDVERLLEVVALDQPAEARGPGDVRALADEDEARVGLDGERLEAAEHGLALELRDPPRRQAADRGGDRLHVLRRRPATAADDVDETVLCELAQVAARVARLLVVEAELVREAGVRVARDVGRRNARQTTRRTGASRSRRASS